MRLFKIIVAFSLSTSSISIVHAETNDMMKMLSPIMLGGGFGSMMASCGKPGGGQGCDMGMMLAMIGMMGMLAGMKQDEKPTEVKCIAQGPARTVVIYGGGGVPAATFSQPAPGQPVVYPSMMPPQYASNLGGQMMGLCNQPMAISNINNALAMPNPPMWMPAAQQQVAYQPVPQPPPVVVAPPGATVIVPASQRQPAQATNPWATMSH